MKNAQALVDRMLGGDRVALAKLMTMVENRHPETAAIMAAIHGRAGRAYTIGITGPPGAGKSTMVDRLVGELRSAGQRVGIVAIDPSSPFSGGALLGDRIRMQSHFLDSSVFIRSLSTRGSHGGLARATRHVSRLLDAFGKDYILVETVGVGQTELDIMRLADTTVVILVPESGDTVQAMKAGLLEIADVFVVNKADREGAMKMETELEMMLHLRPPSPWSVPILLTQADQGKGVAELLATVERHRKFLAESGGAAARTAEGRRDEFLQLLREEIAHRIEAALDRGSFAAVLQQIKHGEIDPFHGAVRVVESPEAAAALRGETQEAAK